MMVFSPEKEESPVPWTRKQGSSKELFAVIEKFLKENEKLSGFMRHFFQKIRSVFQKIPYRGKI